MTQEIVHYLTERRLKKGTLPEERAQQALESLTTAPHTEFLADWLRAFLVSGSLRTPLALPQSTQRAVVPAGGHG